MSTAHFILLVIAVQVQLVLSHKCFVCKPLRLSLVDQNQLKEMFEEEVPFCKDFHKSKRNEFIKECPAKSSGCLTQFEATGAIFRTCTHVPINDCKPLNNVTYCYCKTPLCNSPERKLPDPSLFENHHGEEEVALENQIEGSGGWDDDEDDQEYYDNNITELPDEAFKALEEEYRRKAEEEMIRRNKQREKNQKEENFIFIEDDQEETETESSKFENDIAETDSAASSLFVHHNIYFMLACWSIAIYMTTFPVR